MLLQGHGPRSGGAAGKSCMRAETEQVQLMALTGVLPVHVKLPVRRVLSRMCRLSSHTGISAQLLTQQQQAT